MRKSENLKFQRVGKKSYQSYQPEFQKILTSIDLARDHCYPSAGTPLLRKPRLGKGSEFLPRLGPNPRNTEGPAKADRSEWFACFLDRFCVFPFWSVLGPRAWVRLA